MVFLKDYDADSSDENEGDPLLSTRSSDDTRIIEASTSDLIWLTRMAIFSLVMLGAQCFAGYISNSLALRGDSPHVLMDCIIFGLNVWAEKQKIENPKSSQRWDVCGALLSVCVLVPTAVVIFYEAYGVVWLKQPREVIHEPIVFAFCVANMVGSVAFAFMYSQSSGNIIPFWALFRPACPHCQGGAHAHPTKHELGNEHDCEDQHSCDVRDANSGRRSTISKPGPIRTSSVALKSRLNITTAWIHMLSDTFKSLVLLVASTIMFFHLAPSIYVDAVASVVVGVSILCGLAIVLPHFSRFWFDRSLSI
eukprot:GEMP01031191.1.p1 GENE.GEMP01031191.1~~GEMP01031191.1.p1  ORF type:complete len:308 (+),score=49.20 GEMP01031191.1:145-1068(+)